jgi:hypothetical protein
VAVQQHDPTVLAPVDAYLTDGARLVLVLESDKLAGALVEDARSGDWVDLTPDELSQRRGNGQLIWRRVRPAA